MIFTQQLLGFGGASLWPEAIERHHWRLHAAHVTAGQAPWYLSSIVTHRCHVLVNLWPLTLTQARQRTVLLAMVLWAGPNTTAHPAAVVLAALLSGYPASCSPVRLTHSSAAGSA